MPDFKLGDRVTFRPKDQLVRASDWADTRKGKNWWGRNQYREQDPPRTGVVVGKRTYSDGTVTYSWEGGGAYTPTRHFPVYLVAWDLHQRPGAFLPEDLELAGDGDA